jgi:hypothetical protein
MSTVYYRGARAHITRDLIEVFSPGYAVYPIYELEGVHVVDGSPGRRPAVGVLPVATVLAAVVLPIVGGAVGLLAAVLMLAVGAVVAVAYLRDTGRPYELCATHRGRRVTLFRCSDVRTFGQVKRALARAMEQHADR